MPIKLLSFFSLLFLCHVASGQEIINCEILLDQEPFFVRHKTAESDSLLKRDIAILKHCGNLDRIDTIFLNGSMLGALMLDQVRIGKPATYRTLVDYFISYKKTTAYQDFVAGLALYKSLGDKKINLSNWGADQELFVRMGFTAADLDDFKTFLTSLVPTAFTYKDAFVRYMSELEAMRIDK